MPRPRINPWLFLALAGGIAYPLLVYFGIQSIPHTLFLAITVALIGVRLIGLRKTIGSKNAVHLFAGITSFIMALTLLNGPLAVKAYPILVSLGVASIFGLSLIYPPSAVERMARLHEPDLPPSGVIYTRRVTLIWVVFLVCNAAISLATALWGTLAQWTLWNGLIAYILMGILFIGEYAVRRMVRR